MASLTDKRIKNTYDGLLKTTDNDPLGGSYKLITDGLGNSSNVYLGTGGAVGIGQGSPRGKFDVDGEVYVTTPNGIDSLKISDLSVKIGDYDDANGYAFLHLDSQDFKFTTDSAEVMRITSDGKVGIGTTSPAAKLHISTGSVNTYPTASTNANLLILENKNQTLGHSGLTIFSDNGATGNIYFGDEQSNQVAGITCDNTGGKADLFFTTSNNNERMRIDSSGNVGIGTTSPSSKLHVAGDIRTNNNIVFTGTGFINNNSTNLELETVSNKDIILTPQGTGNVGIGTDSPNTTLEVAGTGISVGGVNYQTIISDNTSLGINKGGGIIFRGVYNSSGTESNFGGIRAGKANSNDGNANAYLSLFYSNGSLVEGLRIKENGNVGIGTTSPEDKLHVDGARSNFNGIKIGENGNKIQFAGVDGNVGVGNNDWFILSEGATEVLRAGGSSGRLGIGTSSPNTTLEVAGVATISASTTNALFVNNSANSTAAIGSTNTYLSINANNYIILGSTTLNYHGIWALNNKPYRFQETDGTWVDILNLSGTDNVLKFGTITDVSTGGDIAFYADNSEKMRIDSSGNVGIGTTSPQDLLHLSSDSPVLRLTNTVDSGQSSIEFWDNQSGTNQHGELFYDDNSNLFGLQGNANGIVFKASNTFPGSELMRLNGSGYLGIGTTSPVIGLQVESSTSEVNRSLRLAYDSSYFFDLRQKGAGGVSYNAQNSTSGGHRFEIDGSEKVRIAYDGNVGIGTTSPSNKLEIVGAYSSTPLKILRHGDYGNVINLGRNGVSETAHIGYPSDATINFSTGGTERMRIESDGDMTMNGGRIFLKESDLGNTALGLSRDADEGYLQIYSSGTQTVQIRGNGDSYINTGSNFGIGTSSPGQRLTVDGNIQATGTRHIAAFYDSNNYMRIEANSSGGVVKGTDGGVITTLIRSYASSYFNGGNFGIGTTSPAQKLHVAGNIRVGNSTDTIYSNRFIGLSNADVLLGANNGYDLLLNSSSGDNVGIGTTSPSQKLHVKADDATLLLQDSTTSFSAQASGIILTSSDSSGNPRTDVQYKLKVNSNTFEITYGASDSQRLKIESDGGLFVPSLLGSSDSNPDVRYNTTTGELYYNSSSIRYKEDVTDIESTIDKINKLRPVKFKVKESQKYTTGLIAEEVVDVLPELVFKRQIEGFDEPQIDGVVYNDLHAYYIKAIQEQQEMINELKTELQTLKSQINS